MDLNYKTLGQGAPVIILHGLLGSLDNWLSFGKELAEDYAVFLLDQRNHGRSPHSDVHDYPSMADDLHTFMDAHWMYDGAFVLGHSMGGKTAMQLALTHPELVKKLIVVDIAPKAYTDLHADILDALCSLKPETLQSREEADKALSGSIPDYGVRQFLLKNLSRRKEGGYTFKVNLPVLQQQYEAILQPLVAEQPYEKPALFVRGSRSPYIQPEDEGLIRQLFPKATIGTIPDAGHWVHADQPQAMLKMVRDFLKVQGE